MGHLRVGSRALCLLVALAVCFVLPGRALADAKVKKQVERKTAEAMEAYDMLEYEQAKKGLAAALLLAKRKGLGKDPVTAKVHVHLGIVYFSGFEDPESAGLEFASALEIDPKVEIPKAYKTKEMLAAFESIRSDIGGDVPVIGPEDSPTDNTSCSLVEGLAHELVESSPAGRKQTVELKVSPDLKAAKVALYYRADGKVDFKEVTMGRQGQCAYSAAIPAEAVQGDVVHYFVSVFDARGKVIARSGSKGSPNIIEVTAAIAEPVGGDDPLSGSGASGGSVSASAQDGAGKVKKLFISLAVGSGGGYVTGSTEATDVQVANGFAPALFHVLPEVGYWLTPRTSISAAFRLGFPVIANVPGHASAAPSGFLRLRHGFNPDGTGFQMSGAVGGGILRHAVKIENAAPGEDTDTTATGPLLLGAGLGYIKSLGDSLRFLAEVNGFVGLPVVDQIGCPGNGCVQPSFGNQFDLNLGFLVAF